jgi:hypothetical protein
VILLDTNMVIDALSGDALKHDWAVNQIASAVAEEGAALNVVTLAELAAGGREIAGMETELRSWGVQIVDLPAAAGDVCGKAYRRYLQKRKQSGHGLSPKVPLPDFFIGAHAQIMGWKLATGDLKRYATYFPSVPLLAP